MRLAFRFSDTSGDSANVQILPSECRALKVGFQNHQMNRTFALRLLEGKPRAAYIRGLYGGTLDLIRVASLLGVRVCLELLEPLRWGDLDARTASACEAALLCVDVLVMGERLVDWPCEGDARRVMNTEEAIGCLSDCASSDGDAKDNLDYALYEFCLRDHPLLVEMQRQYLPHFHGCASVLDLGCGAGIFLEMLGDAGIAAMGVERSPLIAEYACGMGLSVETADALDFLRSDQRGFDGIYCSHFIEHLPFDAVRELVSRMASALNPGGVLLLVFPDPESIRSQLLGFWRDPEHVRFYHPELVELLGVSSGLVCEWKSYDDQPHEVGPFPTHAGFETEIFSFPPLTSGPHRNDQRQWWWRILGKLGLGPLSLSRQQLTALADSCRRQGQALDAMRARVDDLWRVNQTWAWQDNAALRFRKPLSD